MNCPKCGAKISKLKCNICGFVFNSDKYTFLDNKNRQELRAFAEFIHNLTEPESLEVRIGKRISQNLSQEELAEFDAITDNDELAKWLEKHVPNYRQIVNEEIAREENALLERPSATSQITPRTSHVNSDLPGKEDEERRRAAEELAEQKRAAEAVARLIDSIPSFSYTDSFRLELQRARTEFDALSPMAQRWVSNYERLTTEERRFAEIANALPSMPEEPKQNNGKTKGNNSDDESLEAINEIFRMRDEGADRRRDDRAAAERVSHLIGQIGIGNVTLTDECAQRIHDARWAYNALTVQQRSLVDHYSWLTNAEAEYRNLQSEAERKAQKRKSVIRTISILAVLAVIGIIIGYVGMSRKLANNSKSVQTQSSSINVESQGITALATAQRGDRFLFGRYEQDDKVENGTEALEWVVLRNEAGAVLATTVYCIDDKAYNEGNNWTETSWEGCSLRSWLSNEFFNTAFTDQEQDIIGWFQLVATDEEGTPNYEDVIIDRVSLLGMSDIVALYPDYEYAHAVTFYDKNDEPILTTSMSMTTYPELATTYTEYARSQHLLNETEANGESAATRYQNNTEAEYGRGTCNWWLRDEGYEEYSAMEIIWNGAAISAPAHAHIGVRPAIWIKWK